MTDRDHERDEAIARLRELAKQLPYDRPDAARVDAVRSSLLVAATTPEVPARSRWLVVGGAFAIGAAAAAAAILLVLGTAGSRSTRVAASTPDDHHMSIETSTAADFEREVAGTDEVLRVRSGRMSVAGAHVRIATGDAELAGEGRCEVAVTGDVIREVTVKEGTATLRLAHQQPIFLAAGQTWHAPVVTADLQIDARTSEHADIVAPDTDTRPVPETSRTASASDRRTPAVSDAAGKPDRVSTAEPRTSGGETDHVSGFDPKAPTGAKTGDASDASGAGPSDASGTKPGRASDASTKPGDPSDASAKPGNASGTKPADGSGTKPADGSGAKPGDGSGAKPGDGAKPAQRELERHFAAGMQLLKAGKAPEAARELGAAADAGIDDPLAADARYFQAVALTRAGRKTEAEAALVAFLDHAPRSLRRGRAAVMLARLVAERGDTASARAWFESATHDADPVVVAAAKTGLASLAAAH